ncbi:hypothetical protein MIND_00400500 [Mycena indigotica]|uniref:Uncharacterized protein n=1 Tax=Mycena indigotica TaxID=2126181 RepID=A0A8H6T3B1_9AGAR|nr:uncharacterized protein MIND_00400500 [Mycena indigotica]KAF7310266.1 hypothetical protein MIND_00400500 [Mycena indigotica]
MSLTRSPSFTSVRSWWSDANSLGATVNLHSVAKPLIRVLYDIEVRRLVKATRLQEVSAEALEMCFAFLRCRSVASSTKAYLLQEMGKRLPEIRMSDVEQLFPLLDDVIPELFGSPSSQIRGAMCYFLTRLCEKHGPLPTNIVSHCLEAIPFFDSSASQLYGCLCTSVPSALLVSDSIGSQLLPSAAIDDILRYNFSILLGHWTVTDLCNAISPERPTTSNDISETLPRRICPRDILADSALAALRQTIHLSETDCETTLLCTAPAIVHADRDTPLRREFACRLAAGLLAHASGSREAFLLESMMLCLQEVAWQECCGHGVKWAAVQALHQIALSRTSVLRAGSVSFRIVLT